MMALMVLMGICSCSKDEGGEPAPVQGKAISFGASLQSVTAVTRAEGDLPLSEKASSFCVWGFKNMGYTQSSNDYTDPQCVVPEYIVNWVTGTTNSITNSNGWEYVDGTGQSVKYWDPDAIAYRFFGYAPATTSVKTFFSLSGTDEVWEEYEPFDVNWDDGVNYALCRLSISVNAGDEDDNDPTTAAPYLSHLWFSNGNEVPSKFYQPVQLEFFKPLAKVRFMFTFAEGVTLTRDDIEDQVFAPTDQHAGIAISGKVNITIPLTGTSTEEEWSTTPTGYMINSNGDNVYFTKDWYECSDANSPLYAGREYWYTVLPAKDQGSYTLTANISGSDQTAVVPAEFMQWSPGYSYTYIFKVMTGGGIKFDEVQVAIRQWELTPPTERKVYNW